MVKVLVVGHATIDHIISSTLDFESLGGPPAYAGLTAKRLGADVDVATKVGLDFPEHYALFLSRYTNMLKPALSPAKPTTRFLIEQQGGSRRLKLLGRCEDIEENQIEGGDYDICVLSPVAGEVSNRLVSAAKRVSKYLFLDPQGFLRRFNQQGFCLLSDMDRALLEHADVLKVDYEEMRSLTGLDDKAQALAELHSLGPKVVILTSHRGYVILSLENKIYRIPIPDLGKVVDTTGAGDILAGAYAATYPKERDVLFAVCVGVSAATLSVKGMGISKIPTREEVFELVKRIMSGVEDC